MPDMKHRESSDPALADVFRLLAEDDDQTPVPSRIEAAIMQAWDTQARSSARPHPRAVRLAWAAALLAAAGVGLAAALWLQRTDDDRSTLRAIAEAPNTRALDDWYGPRSIALPDVLLQDDPASLRLVRLTVQPSVLTAFGYPAADPMDMRPVSVEVLVGLDGVPRAIRRLDGDGSALVR
jgi:hypothetical protein